VSALHYGLPASHTEARGGAFSWGTAQQSGSSRLRYPMGQLKFFSDVILPAALWHRGRLSLLTDMSTRNVSPVHRDNNHTTIMWGLSRNSGSLHLLKPSRIIATGHLKIENISIGVLYTARNCFVWGHILCVSAPPFFETSYRRAITGNVT
jgi:hypothetical protein